FTLGNIGSKRATKGLVEALEFDEEGQVPEAVLFALMWIKDASALPALRAELKQETNPERRRSLENVIRTIEESAWGEAVEGVQMRVRAERLVWRQDEIPLFKAQLRCINKDEGMVWEGFRERVEMEVDGQWYRSLLETSSTPFRLTTAKPIKNQ
ncbi:MAG: HEAT repeat domain-containing protein, partial [Planctomycetota bacterium]